MSQPPPPDDVRQLPSFSVHNREQAVLEASRAVVGLFLASRSSDYSVKALAEHAGLSERTFYRYFPRKEDAIRPYVEAGLHHIVRRVREAPPERPLREALIVAHAEILDAAQADDGPALIALLNGTERLRALWLQVVTDAEAAFAAVVAERLGIDADSLQARLAGGLVVTAGRLALQAATRGGAFTATFAECLDFAGPGLLTRREG